MEAEHFAELDALDSGYWWFATRFDAVWRHGTRALGTEPVSVVDLGCGTGMFLAWLLAEKRLSKRHVLGYEGSGLGLEAATRRGLPVEPLDLNRTELRTVLRDPPDMFAMLDVLEHLPEPVDALRAVRHASRPGGVLMLTVPALPMLWSSWDERLGHYRRYTAATLRADLRAAGWQVRGMQYLFFGMVLPAVLRRMRSGDARQGDPGFPPLPASANAVLRALTKAEARLGRLLPLGTSLVAAAQCPMDGHGAGAGNDQADAMGEPRPSNSSK